MTPDPITAASIWTLYAFPYFGFADYSKIGVWPDAYYMGSNFLNAAWAFDRAKMLAGLPATFIQFPNFEFMLPSDIESANSLPPVGAPNVFIGTMNVLALREFHLDWSVPTSSTFSFTLVSAAPFDSFFCNGPAWPCIPQAGSASAKLVPVGGSFAPMYRLSYRRRRPPGPLPVGFVADETLVLNQTVNVGSVTNPVAGIRWYELRKPAGGVWSAFQEGTLQDKSPMLDPTHRWMGSMAMDASGNIAIGYSVSSRTTSPSIRYTGRLATDPLGTMPQGEVTAFVGGGSQLVSSRWGDYSAMSVDPVDDCTFWYTTEYTPFTRSSPESVGTPVFMRLDGGGGWR